MNAADKLLCSDGVNEGVSVCGGLSTFLIVRSRFLF
jgi:hypothetical protein